ncbi:hypothetical protein QL996_06355 [Planococcus sp. APC 4015]|nr:hypothetical protein [Planococcus sp. APC 4015]
MSLDPAVLLAGPRGRGLCLAYAFACADPESSAQLGWAIRGREGHGTSALSCVGDPPPQPYVPPVVTDEEAASVLEAVTLADPSTASLRDALADSVDHAMYWQPPGGSDLLAAESVMRAPLARIAAVICASPHAQWWATGVPHDDQWVVSWDGEGGSPDDPRAVLTRWRDAVAADESRLAAEHRADPRDWSGEWWSKPPSDLVHSTRSLAGDGPAGLWFVEDSSGWTSAVATPVLAASAHVFEVDGPHAWADLCRRHPLDVTASRRHDWFRATGRDGEWTQPDWSSVAEEFDGVHVTVSGYLSAATRAIDVGDGRASVLAGWAPDETFWFDRTLSGGAAQVWRAEDSATGRRWMRD